MQIEQARGVPTSNDIEGPTLSLPYIFRWRLSRVILIVIRGKFRHRGRTTNVTIVLLTRTPRGLASVLE